jgi:hypothetical protein
LFPASHHNARPLFPSSSSSSPMAGAWSSMGWRVSPSREADVRGPAQSTLSRGGPSSTSPGGSPSSSSREAAARVPAWSSSPRGCCVAARWSYRSLFCFSLSPGGSALNIPHGVCRLLRR